MQTRPEIGEVVINSWKGLEGKYYVVTGHDLNKQWCVYLTDFDTGEALSLSRKYSPTAWDKAWLTPVPKFVAKVNQIVI